MSERASDPWARYVPDERCPWDLRRVVHLHRRAGFAATWAELQRDLKDGPQGCVDRVLAGGGFELIEIPRAALFLTGKVFKRYRAQGGTRSASRFFYRRPSGNRRHRE